MRGSAYPRASLRIEERSLRGERVKTVDRRVGVNGAYRTLTVDELFPGRITAADTDKQLAHLIHARSELPPPALFRESIDTILGDSHLSKRKNHWELGPGATY